jgi:hypothetical protein
MRSQDAREERERLLAVRGLAVAGLSVRDGIEAMLDFYRTVRADDCVIADDGDMLLFQWGTYEAGNVAEFHVDLTRQFIRAGGEDDDIWQLSLTFGFAPAAIASGDRWCATPGELAAFAAFVRSHPSWAMPAPIGVKLAFEPVG